MLPVSTAASLPLEPHLSLVSSQSLSWDERFRPRDIHSCPNRVSTQTLEPGTTCAPQLVTGCPTRQRPKRTAGRSKNVVHSALELRSPRVWTPRRKQVNCSENLPVRRGTAAPLGPAEPGRVDGGDRRGGPAADTTFPPASKLPVHVFCSVGFSVPVPTSPPSCVSLLLLLCPWSCGSVRDGLCHQNDLVFPCHVPVFSVVPWVWLGLEKPFEFCKSFSRSS